MSYIVTLTNGNILATIPDTQLVSTYGGLDLIGKNYAGFGTAFNDNLVHMVEHFADSTPPTNPFIGQIWYDTISNAINFWNGTQFKPISVITSSQTAPLDPQEGDEWYDSVNQQLYIWNGSEWILIGPPYQGNTKEGFVVASIPGITGNIFYLQLYANNNLLGIVSSVELTNPDIVGFGNLRVGWNFVTNPESTPEILASGIYNVSEITLGDADQLAFETDEWNNAIFQVNSGNVLVATNGNSEANTAAYTQFTNGNIVGTVYVDTLIANNYGNLPISGAPGSPSQVSYNNAGIFAGSNALTILPSNVTARLDHLAVSAEAVIDGEVTAGSLSVVGAASVGGTLVAGGTTLSSLTVNGLTSVNGNLDVSSFGTFSGLVTGTIYATSYENLPPFSIPGSTGEVLFNDGGSVGATSALVIEGPVVAINQLTVNTNAQIIGALDANGIGCATINTTGDVIVGGTLSVSGATTLDTNLLVEGTASFNTGGNEFSLPLTRGSSGNPLISNGDGTTQWSTANLSNIASGTSGGNYWERSASGKFTMWGTVTTDINGGTLGVSFPTNFTVLASISVVVTTKSTTDRITYVVDGSVTTSGFTIGNNGSAGFAYWQAVGF